MFMLRPQFLSQILASCFLFIFGGGRYLGGIGVDRGSFRVLPLFVLLLSLARYKIGHFSRIKIPRLFKKDVQNANLRVL